MFSFDDIKTFAAIAEAHNACDQELSVIKSIDNIEDVLNHQNAPYWAYWYAKDVIKGRWAEAEAVISTSPEWAYLYAMHVVKGRWAEAEPTISTSAEYAYWYAINVINGRWAEAEATIMTSPEWACLYTGDVLMIPYN